MRKLSRVATITWVLVVMLILTASCDTNDKETPDKTVFAPTGDSAQMPSTEDVVITIGNLTDKTGSGSSAMVTIDMALEDLVRYYNEENLIPGVRLKVVEYDGGYDPAKDIPGYEWLIERGADVIWTNPPATPVMLRSRVDEDQIPMFSAAAGRDVLIPPGYTFCPSALPEDTAYTLLKWISENDPDFPQNRPAKIGAAGWDTPYNLSLHTGMKEYIAAHSDQFEWAGSHTTSFSFTWGPEVDALKDCDYIMAPVLMLNFAKEYRMAGYNAKFLATAAQAAYLELIDDARLWDEVEGSIFILPNGWWNDEYEFIDLTKMILNRYRADTANDLIARGSSYLAIYQINQMLEIVSNAVENVGVENFDSSAVYEAAQSYTHIMDGEVRASFTETKRASSDYLSIYELRTEDKDLFRIDADWYPVIHSP